MKMSTKKRVVVGAGVFSTLGAVVTLVAGVTFGFFSATMPGQDSTFAAGTVSLDQSAPVACNVARIQPGDSGTCTFYATYNGTVLGGAYLGVDLAVTNPVAATPVQAYAPGNVGTTPTAAGGLYDGTPNGLQVTITDNQTPIVKYMNATLWNNTSATGTAPLVNDLLVNNTPITGTTPITFTIAWSLPSSANNAYDDAGSTITMLVHAVQASHNGTPASIANCTVGDVCSAITHWS
jgi:hypothetical protein